jgi:hypothetical protein
MSAITAPDAVLDTEAIIKKLRAQFAESPVTGMDCFISTAWRDDHQLREVLDRLVADGCIYRCSKCGWELDIRPVTECNDLYDPPGDFYQQQLDGIEPARLPRVRHFDGEFDDGMVEMH